MFNKWCIRRCSHTKIHAQYYFPKRNLRERRRLLTYETLRFTASFPELSSSFFRRRKSQSFRVKSMSSVQGCFSKRTESASYPKALAHRKWSLDSRQASNHLTLDISKRATGARCRSSSVRPPECLLGVHPTEQRSRGAERGDDAAQRREMSSSICPWARARGREDAGRPRGGLPPLRAPPERDKWSARLVSTETQWHKVWRARWRGADVGVVSADVGYLCDKR